MRYHVLGPVEVQRDGEPVAVGGPQQRRLLAMLLVNRGHAVSTDRLVDALWPEGDQPDGAARSVMTYVSRLRAALGDGVVETSGAGYRLVVGSDAVDADHFTTLMDAAERALPDDAIRLYDEGLALWSGTAFGDFGVEWWALSESTRLHERRALAREERAAAQLAIGHARRAIPDLEALVVDEPLRERPVRLLMTALHESGRPADALRCLQQFRERLVDATGLDPSPELLDLERALLSDEPIDASTPGRPLRGYTIHEVLGEGAFGRVYAATQPGTNRRVAIKAIRPDLADTAEFVRRFEAEAQLVARLEHPHIVPLYDYWREPGGAYLVFRLLPGGSARESVVAGGPWSLARVDRLLEQVGAAAMSAHAAGVVHGDLTARNVLLDEQGAAYLGDFGLASMDSPDVASDVRDLGWLAWELISGARPHPPTAPDSLVGRPGLDIPDGLDAVLARATAPQGGYASVAEFLLSWRSVVDRADPGGLASDERRAADSARRSAARRLERDAVAGINPYRGLRSFDEVDAEMFFGRDEVVANLLSMLDERRLVALIGSSGSGKSSVVRAGLVPALRRQGRPVVSMVPGERPLAALQAARREVAVAASGTRWPSGVVVVVDQFEELWTRADDEARGQFVDALVGRVLADPSARVVITLRADFVELPLMEARLGPMLGDGSLLLPPLAPTQLEQAVTLPAERVGVVVDPGVVATVVSDAAAHPGSLPLLQFAMREMYELRRDGRIDADALDRIGGLTGAIGRRADEVFQSLDAESQDAVRTLFTRLLVPVAGVAARRRTPITELSAVERQVAERFVTARLLSSDHDRVSRVPTVEVAHEAIVDRWDRLTRWIDDDAAWFAQLHHVADASARWHREGRPDGDLYRGARLEGMLDSLRQGRTLAPTEAEFVDASRAARDADLIAARASARRLRRAVVGVAAALVVALIAAGVAVVQRREAGQAADEARAATADAESAAQAATAAERNAQIEALVGRSESLRATQRDTAALLAIEAYRLADTPRTRSALFATFANDQGFLDATRFDQVFGYGGIVMPDGETAFLLDGSGAPRPYDLQAGEVGEPFEELGDGVGDFAFLRASPDSTILATVAEPAAGQPGGVFVAVHDVDTGRLRFPPIQLDEFMESTELSADGSTLFVVVTSSDAIAIDTTDGSIRGRIPALPGGLGGGVARVGSDRMVIGSNDRTAQIVDVATLAVIDSIDVPVGSTYTFRTDGTDDVVGSGPSAVIRIDVDTGEVVPLDTIAPQRCGNFALSVPREAIYCADAFGRLEERSLDDGSLLRRLDAQNGNSGQLFLARDDTELVSFGNNEAVVSRWRLDGSGPITRRLEPGWAVPVFSPDGAQLLVERRPSWDPVVDPLDLQTRVVDTATGGIVVESLGLVGASWAADDRIRGARATPAGLEVVNRTVSSGSVEPTGEVLTAVPDEYWAPTGYSRPWVVYFTEPTATEPRPAVLQTFVDGRLSGTPIEVPDYVWSAVSPSGHRVAIGTIDGVRVFDGESGREVWSDREPDLRGVFITLADDLIVSSLGGEVQVRNLDTGDVVRTLGGSRGFVQEVHSTADGSMIAIRGGDGTIGLFDVASGVQIGLPITISDDEVTTIALSLDGTTLAAGGGVDDGVALWDLRPESWITAACALAGRDLTPGEWADNIGDLAEYRRTCSG